MITALCLTGGTLLVLSGLGVAVPVVATFMAGEITGVICTVSTVVIVAVA
jgi:hypothetical protein